MKILNGITTQIIIGKSTGNRQQTATKRANNIMIIWLMCSQRQASNWAKRWCHVQHLGSQGRERLTPTGTGQRGVAIATVQQPMVHSLTRSNIIPHALVLIQDTIPARIVIIYSSSYHHILFVNLNNYIKYSTVYIFIGVCS